MGNDNILTEVRQLLGRENGPVPTDQVLDQIRGLIQRAEDPPPAPELLQLSVAIDEQSGRFWTSHNLPTGDADRLMEALGRVLDVFRELDRQWNHSRLEIAKAQARAAVEAAPANGQTGDESG